MYCSLLRYVLEYASVVFANLPQYLSKALERVQKRALRIIFGPDLSYEDTLGHAKKFAPNKKMATVFYI